MVTVRTSRRASVRGTAAAAALVVAALLLAGCTAGEPAPGPSETAAASSTPTPTPTPDPELVVGGTAGQNRPYFEFILTNLLERSERPTSATILNSLAAAGFDRATIEITPDTTGVGELADSILVGIPIDGQCLLGQIIDGELVSELADVLGTGRCLVGHTLSLD